MRILVTGAYGFIGSAVVARLLADGHAIAGVGRHCAVAALRFPEARWINLDIARARHPDDWLPYLDDVDAVVNCAGVLQDSPLDSTRALHVDGIGALYAACEEAGVRRVIHISVIGLGPDSPTAFSQSKLAADQALMARKLDWVILRPSVVVGRASYGGSALFRALAALPRYIPVLADAGALQPVQLDDVVATVAFFLKPGAPARLVLELAGPERLAFGQLIAAYRRWFGFSAGRELSLPRWFAHLFFLLGDLASLLGWRPPMRTTSERELTRGAVGDPAEWTRLTGIVPRSLAAALAAEPASVQERWFARAYLLKPPAIAGLSLFWMLTGGHRVFMAWSTGFSVVSRAGWAGAYFVLDAAIALLLGILLGFRASARLALVAMLMLLTARIGVAAAFTSVSLVAIAEAAIEMIPAALAVLFTLAILDDR